MTDWGEFHVERCSVCGQVRRSGICNRGVCGQPRVLSMVLSVNGRTVKKSVDVPPHVHMSRILVLDEAECG